MPALPGKPFLEPVVSKDLQAALEQFAAINADLAGR